MNKKVKYNGGTMSYYSCSNPAKLEIGRIYTIIGINVRDWQTDYNLAGVTGHFNSVWFDEVN